MKVHLVAALIGAAGCAQATFHAGRTTLAQREQPYLAPRLGAPSAVFSRFWLAPGTRRWGLMRWDESKSSAAISAPGDLLQAIRDEMGRVNQAAPAGDDIVLAVTVYRFTKGGIWDVPTAFYELVARDMRGQVVWAADDKIEAREALAQSLVDPPSAIIAREILRKVRRQFRL